MGAVTGAAACLLPIAVSTRGRSEQTIFWRPPSRAIAQIKQEAALANAGLPIPANRPDGATKNFIRINRRYHKGLPHNETGEADPRAYRALLHALESGRPVDFNKQTTLGGNMKLRTPQGGLAFDLEAGDSHQTFMATPPALASAWRAGEAVEDYWMALLRDVNFSDYATNPTATAAITELNRLSDFRGPKQKGQVTSTPFRGRYRRSGRFYVSDSASAFPVRCPEHQLTILDA